MRWLCLIFATGALAQTPAVPEKAPTTPADATPVVQPAAAAAASTADLMRAAIEKQRASIAAQQQAVRKQAESAGAKLVPWTPAPLFPPEAPPCDPIADEVVAPIIENAAKANELEVKLVRAVIEQESGFRPCAVSVKGAQGLMQILPDTAVELKLKDVFDPKENIAAGTKYLKGLLDKYKGDTKLALAAYNAGPAAVDSAGGVPDIAETREYVDAILKKIK